MRCERKVRKVKKKRNPHQNYEKPRNPYIASIGLGGRYPVCDWYPPVMKLAMFD